MILRFSKSKQSIQTVQHDLYIKMCFEIKFYIFFKKNLLFIKYFTKVLFLDDFGPLKNNSFVKYLMNIKKIQKNVKFDLKTHFNVEVMLNALDRLFGL